MNHCTICSLGEAHPGVTLNSDQVCNLCTLDIGSELVDNFTYTSGIYEQFRAGAADPGAPYDCLFMYSGGKDSTYMLDRFVNEYGKRVLAYTFDVPFESVHTAENIRLARDRIAATYIVDSDDDGIRTLMRTVFNLAAPAKPGRYLDEKLPCASCRTYFVLRAIRHAYRARIPYVVLCADPQQILTMESNVREVVKGFYRTFGADLVGELFDGDLEELLFAADGDLPKIVFPFVGSRHQYDPGRIVAELKAKGLYESSPLETHCTLFPLLNYYSFKHWDCMFYKLNAASQLRAVHHNAEHDRCTFGIRFPRAANLPEIEERLKAVTFEIAAGAGDARAHEEALVAIFEELAAPAEAARYVARGFLDMREVAADLGIRID